MALYIVPTPIGNLEDITLRALRVLREVRLIAAEDTRTTHVLLNHYQITTPMISYHEHNKLTRIDDVLSALDRGDVALVSDAGTPGLSDPGYELISACLEAGVKVVPLPGAAAAIVALVASGLPTDRFTFLGFLPRKPQVLRALLVEVRGDLYTLIAYESPHRLEATLEAVIEIMGPDRRVCVGREMTKLYEEFFRGTASEALAYFREAPIRGEVTLLIGGAKRENLRWSEAQVRAALRERLAEGESRNAAAKTIAEESGWNKRDVYTLDAEDA